MPKFPRNRREHYEKHRGFAFTCNNYTDEDEKRIQAVENKYLIYGYEIAPTTGTPHLQGFIYFKSPRTLTKVQKIMPGCHVEPMYEYSTPAKNREYCSKMQNFKEFGTCPLTPKQKGQKEKDRWATALSQVQKGEFDQVEPSITMRMGHNFPKILSLVNAGDLKQPPRVEYIHPYREAVRQFPDAYRKPRGKWWDHYIHQEEVIIHEEDADQYETLTDEFHFIVETKGGSMQIRPKVVIIVPKKE